MLSATDELKVLEMPGQYKLAARKAAIWVLFLFLSPARSLGAVLLFFLIPPSICLNGLSQHRGV